jgi:hypothetical protein
MYFHYLDIFIVLRGGGGRQKGIWVEKSFEKQQLGTSVIIFKCYRDGTVNTRRIGQSTFCKIG